MHAGAADRKFASVKCRTFNKKYFKSKKKIHARNFWWRVPVRQGRSEVKQLRGLFSIQNLSLHVRAVDLTVSVGFLRVRSLKICLEHPRIERWYMSRWRVSEWFRDWGASWKNSLWAWRERWKGTDFGRRETTTRPFYASSIWQKQRRCQGQALTPGACMFHTVLRSVARLSTSAGLPPDVEAVLCKLYSHHSHAAAHTKISTNTPTKEIKRTGMFEYKSWYTSIDAYKT